MKVVTLLVASALVACEPSAPPPVEPRDRVLWIVGGAVIAGTALALGAAP